MTTALRTFLSAMDNMTYVSKAARDEALQKVCDSIRLTAKTGITPKTLRQFMEAMGWLSTDDKGFFVVRLTSEPPPFLNAETVQWADIRKSMYDLADRLKANSNMDVIGHLVASLCGQVDKATEEANELKARLAVVVPVAAPPMVAAEMVGVKPFVVCEGSLRSDVQFPECGQSKTPPTPCADSFCAASCTTCKWPDPAPWPPSPHKVADDRSWQLPKVPAEFVPMQDLFRREGVDPNEVLRNGYTRAEWEAPSLAFVVFSTAAGERNEKGVVLATSGPHVEAVIEDVSSVAVDDLGMVDPPSGQGFYVWKGKDVTTHTNTPDCNEYDSELVGEWRPATEAEVLRFSQGMNPLW